MENFLNNAQNAKDCYYLLKTLRSIYPLMISVNLTKNTYRMIEYDTYLNKTADYDGVFDDLIAVGASTMHPDHQQMFIDTFCRENQLRLFGEGENEINLDCRQIDANGVYHWVHTQVLRVYEPDTDDVLQFTFSRPNDAIMELESKNTELEYLRNSQAGGYHRCQVAEGYPFIDISPRFCEIFGYTEDEIRTLFDNKYSNMVYPDDVEKMDSHIIDRLTIDGITSAHFSYRMRHKTKGWIWVKDSTELCKFGDDEFYQGIVLDITDEHDILESLVDKNRQLDIVMQSIPGGIVVSKINGDIVPEFISDEVAIAFGYTVEEFRDFISESMHKENSEKLLSERIDALKDGKYYSIQFPLRDKKGKRRYVAEYGKLHTDSNGENRLYSFLMDVTDEYEKTMLVQSQQRDLSQLETINVLAMDYSYVFFNDLDTGRTEMLSVSDKKVVEGLYGKKKLFPFTDTIETYAYKFVYKDDLKEFIEATSEVVVRKELSEHDDYVYYFRSVIEGEPKFRQVKFTRYNKKADTFQILVGFKDIDEQMRKEQEQKALLADALAQAEYANKAKSQFLNSMSHDIRTPMNAIMGYTALATTHIDNKERVLDYLTKVSHASSHLLSLINDVLDMSRIESGKMHIDEQEASLADIIHDIRSIIQSDIQARQLEFFVDIMDVTEEHIFCDKLRLNQVLLNLLSNAIKFTAPGGMISLRIIQKSISETGIVTYEFRVKDTGIGMSKKFLAEIFEPFTRARTSTASNIPGTGLGMAITKNIVDMLNGTIEIHSEEGKGTEFVVSLPFRLQSSPKKVEVITKLQGVRGMVVDDDINTCMSVSKMLRQIGMRSEWSMYGKEAVARANEAMEMGDPFHVYIIDWLMADMNGIETVRQIRKNVGEDVPIIILTAYDWADIEEEAREAGVTAFINKPLFLSDLRRVLSEACYDKVETEPSQDFTVDGCRILLTEDNELNQEIAYELLSDAGFEVDIAENGQVAINMLTDKAPGYYNLILMDVQMPIMDGYEATRTIRALENKDYAHIPIVAMTANAFKSDEQAAINAGMDGFVAKPVRIGEILNIITPLLNEGK